VGLFSSGYQIQSTGSAAFQAAIFLSPRTLTHHRPF
jgi:hypothetical protein